MTEGAERACQRGPSRHDRGDPAGMTEGPEQACQRGPIRHVNRLAESMAFPMRGHTIPSMSFPTSSIPFRHSRHLQPPSVIPDVFNRESMAFPMQDPTNEGTEEKDTGFPLTTGGNDRGGPSGYDRGARSGMTEGTGRVCQQACRIQGVSHAGPHDSAHVIPDVFNPPFRHSRRF